MSNDVLAAFHSVLDPLLLALWSFTGVQRVLVAILIMRSYEDELRGSRNAQPLCARIEDTVQREKRKRRCGER